ncbi:Mitochondrial intermediate peptidase [Frankliniella fusca]|uniref:Mitochondrial intermediate peptidase n=1 Tax=Frankliniella fusca TaxID=407009 RepID=A0AAE1HSJ3_9NEOP|nr:Mitochondrial intermediate peptidase [Frankliniella fusca]
MLVKDMQCAASKVLRKISCFGHLFLHRHVSTLSPLATAFNSRPNRRLNLTLQKDVGLFGLDQLRQPDGFQEMKEQAIADTHRLVQETCDPHRTRKMVVVFDELSDSLCKVADLAEFIRLAHPIEAFSTAAEDACITINSIVEHLNTNRDLYQAIRSVSESGDICPTTDVDEHVAQLFLFDFEQSGIHLEETDRQRVVRLNDEILQKGQKFMAGTALPRTVHRKLLPQNIQHLFSISGDQVLVAGLYGDSPNCAAREWAYRVFLFPDEQQEVLLKELLSARHELAVTCGFPSYAHRAVKGSTVEKPEVVNDFLHILAEKLRPHSEKDLEVMRSMKKVEIGSSSDIFPWDTLYYTRKIKREWLQAPSSDFSPFFSLGNCMEGLNLLVNALYNIQLRTVEMLPGEAWTQDVYKLEVVHETEGVLGHIYCDFYQRAGKPNQDCHFTIKGGKVLPDGSYQNPVVVLMLNFPTPKWSSPSLLSPGMVDNLFHEMGHALHSMMARTQYQHVTGTRCPTDFAEVPSVLMEYFAADPRVLGLFARHFQTQEPMPTHMLERLCASKHLFAASEMQLQVFYSALDQMYHSQHPLGSTGSTSDVIASLQEEYYNISYIPKTAWQLRFSHLVSYGAKYYSYLVSRAIASWIWQNYFQADPLSRTCGEQYRRECLAHGGGKPPHLLVSDYLKKDVTANQLASSLLQDLDTKNNYIKDMCKNSMKCPS